MDIGDLLYVLIGIAWVVYSFVKKKKKTASPGPDHAEEEYDEVYEETEGDQDIYEEDVHEDKRKNILEEIIKMAEAQADQTEEVSDPTPPKEAQPVPIIEPDKMHANQHFSEGEGWIPNKDKEEKIPPKPPKEDPSYKTQDEDEQGTEIDLREAIIHSEIINRPEY